MRMRRSLPWLGWALAGVLGLSAVGTALASSQASDAKSAAALTTQDTGQAGQHERRADRWGRLGHLRPFRRAVHGEVTVRSGQDAGGKPQFTQVVFARGEIAGLSGDTLRVRSADGVVTEFRLSGDTMLRRRGEDVPRSALQAGVAVFAVGKRDGQTVTAVRVLLAAPR